MKLNLGSGMMLLDGYVNFDAQRMAVSGKVTDVIGRIEDVRSHFLEESFDEVLCSHVIEHFYRSDVLKVLKDIHWLLAKGGIAIIECPDLRGMYATCKDDLELSQMLYGDEVHRFKWGSHWMHKSGWTGQLMADEMERVGFGIKRIGPGTTHGRPMRDFRVEGVKHVALPQKGGG